MNRQQLRSVSAELAYLALFLIGCYVMTAVREANQLDKQLEEQRRQRAHLENELEKRETQLNQALEHIHGTNGDEQPAE